MHMGQNWPRQKASASAKVIEHDYMVYLVSLVAELQNWIRAVCDVSSQEMVFRGTG